MNWKEIIKEESEKDYFKNLFDKIKSDSKNNVIYPPADDVFNAFKYCELDQTKVVILGQDVYHGPGQAHGLSFSVLPGVPLPPSLRNIFKELKNDLAIENKSGCLIPWAKQGVLLLNSILTVRDGSPASHAKFGWETFTDKIIQTLNDKQQPVVFVLWGSFAKSKASLITNKYHHIITSAHPSPLSAHNGFFGSKPFSKINNFLIDNSNNPIDWSLDAQLSIQ